MIQRIRQGNIERELMLRNLIIFELLGLYKISEASSQL